MRFYLNIKSEGVLFSVYIRSTVGEGLRLLASCNHRAYVLQVYAVASSPVVSLRFVRQALPFSV